MAPALFSRVTRAQAVEAFGADAPAETYCDGNFVKLDGAVLVFATLAGEVERDSHTQTGLIGESRMPTVTRGGCPRPFATLSMPSASACSSTSC